MGRTETPVGWGCVVVLAFPTPGPYDVTLHRPRECFLEKQHRAIWTIAVSLEVFEYKPKPTCFLYLICTYIHKTKQFFFSQKGRKKTNDPKCVFYEHFWLSLNHILSRQALHTRKTSKKTFSSLSHVVSGLPAKRNNFRGRKRPLTLYLWLP